MFYVSPERVYFLMPAQTEIGNADVVITNADGFASRGTVPVLRTAPGIFTKTGDGIGEGMILNADTLGEGPFDPTNGNLRLLIFTTGARNSIQTTVKMGGRIVNTESVLPSTDMVGLDEVRVRVPSDLRGTGAVNLFMTSDGRESNSATLTFTGDPSRNVLINEVLADPPSGIAGDANRDGSRDGTQDEFVEFINGTSNELINVGNWTIRTRPIGGTTETTRFTFPSGSSLPAGDAIVVFGGGNFNSADPVFGCAQVMKANTSAGLSLTNSGLTILLRDGAGNLINQFSYGGSTGFDGGNSQSLTRSPDIGGAFTQHTGAAGANGAAYSPGLRVNGTPFGNCPGHLVTVTIAPASASLTVGQTTQFTSEAFDQYGRRMTNVNFNFISDNASVATVQSVTINPNTGVATANVKTTNPGIVHIIASATDGTTTVNSSEATLTVTGPSLSVNDISQNEGDSGTTTFTFTVSLSTPAPAPVIFDIATHDNTATTANNDYIGRALTGQTIGAGLQTYTFDVTVNGDVNLEPTEVFFVNVSNVSGASVSDAQGIGTIVTDDVPKLSVNDVSLLEGNTGATTFTFTVSSSLPAPSGGIAFDVSTQNGTAVSGPDYLARSLTSANIPAGQTSYAFAVTVNGDTLVEPNETFFVNISNVSANAAIDDGQGQGTIQNDDAASLVISQVYGGGGNAGATYTNDFIEIFNRGTTTIDFAVTPYSVQYAAATSNFSTNKTDITSGTLLPGHHFLIREASGGSTGAALPTPDVPGGTINLSATAGKVALVLGTAALTGSGCPFGATIVDFIGYGTAANCSETSPIAVSGTNSNARSVVRANTCTDTNNNSADFTNPTTAPTARNAATTLNSCP
jgi:lamin tail-like protein/Calx-beta domain-containing protein